ncbi:hypothetical protein AB3515_14460 [Acinetobacter baumannii]
MIEPSYSVSTYGNSGLSFYYKLDKNQFVRVEYDKLSGKVINARIDTEKSSLTCRNDKWTPEGCEGISMIYDSRTGDSTLLFNNKNLKIHIIRIPPRIIKGNVFSYIEWYGKREY